MQKGEEARKHVERKGVNVIKGERLSAGKLLIHDSVNPSTYWHPVNAYSIIIPQGLIYIPQPRYSGPSCTRMS